MVRHHGILVSGRTSNVITILIFNTDRIKILLIDELFIYNLWIRPVFSLWIPFTSLFLSSSRFYNVWNVVVQPGGPFPL